MIVANAGEKGDPYMHSPFSWEVLLHYAKCVLVCRPAMHNKGLSHAHCELDLFNESFVALGFNRQML